MLSQEQFQYFLSQTEVGFCVIDQEYVIEELNESFANAARSEQPIGEKLSDMILSERTLEDSLEKVLTEGKATFEVNFNCCDNPFFAIANATLLEAENGEAAKIAVFFTEVNERKHLESKLEERIADEVEKNREKDEMMNQQAKLATMGEMIGNIAHQWRQPLNILALVFQDIYIKYQLNALDAEQMEKNYEKVNNLLQYMSQTIDDFRTFFKTEDGDAEFRISTAINAVFDLVGTRFSSSYTECDINILDDSVVMGTENGFKQVVINLLNNAQEAILSENPEKGIIGIKVEKVDKMIVVTVSDNGGGVPKKIMNQIFEPYFTTKHQAQGTGLGLYMSKQIIEHHMVGKLGVNNSSEGAVFTISLPVVS
jgi:C4-dicarboxylate-specific signal transduction histidine kinase